MTGELTITTPAEPAPVDIPGDDDAMGAVFDRLVTQNGADRGEGGKFTSPAAAEGAQGGEQPPAGTLPPEGGEGAASSPVTAAPAHLPQALKAEWEKMPEVARAEVAKLTTEWDRKFGEIGKQYGAVKPIADKIMGAATQFPEFKGFTADQIADGALQLAAVQARLERGPESAVSTIMEVAKAYNVLPLLAQAFGQQGQQGDGQQVAQLQQHIARLEQQIARSANPEFIREQITSTMTERETETVVRAFAAKDGVKDYWADVEAQIPRFIQVVQGDPASQEKSVEEILTEAYDMAINALPDVRAKVRAAEAKATAAQPDPKKTEAAKRAASINVPSTTSGKERVMTEDELLAAAYDRKMAN